jgi:hypothetical protein
MTLSCFAFPLKCIYIKNNSCKRIKQLFKSIYRHDVLVYHEKPMKEYFVADDIDIDIDIDVRRDELMTLSCYAFLKCICI